jgi:hypothetical protein
VREREREKERVSEGDVCRYIQTSRYIHRHVHKYTDTHTQSWQWNGDSMTAMMKMTEDLTENLTIQDSIYNSFQASGPDWTLLLFVLLYLHDDASSEFRVITARYEFQSGAAAAQCV